MAFDSHQIKRIYITRLVRSLIPSEFGDEYINSVTNELFRAVETPSNFDRQQRSYDITNQYKQVFLSKGDTKLWLKFQEIIQSLLTLKPREKVDNYLVFLGCLMGIDTDTRTQPISSNIPPQRMIPQQISSLGIPQLEQRHINLQSSPYMRSQSPIAPTNDTTMHYIIKPYYETLDEEIILKYLPYTLIGIDSKLFTFIKSKDLLRIEIPNNINNSYSSILSKIFEPGLLYLKLKEIQKHPSPIKTSFLSILDMELNEYSNFINILFSQQPSSLILIYNQLYTRTLKLRLFYTLHQQLSLTGYEFLTRVHELSKFGDDIIGDTSNTIFTKIVKPYYEILETWVLKGELIDANNEFFVEVNDNPNINQAIRYLPEKVPKFFGSGKFGFKVYQIGKILVFLKFCKELRWVNDYVMKYAPLLSNIQEMKFTTLCQLIKNQYNELVNYLTVVIHGKYELWHHISNLKTFLLMSSNDFIESIIIKGFDLFNEPSNQLTSNQLYKILLESIQFSSIKNYSNDVKSRLDARILDLSHGNIGWQVFTLEYRINDLPIQMILGDNLEYLKFFNFLWKLKQFQYLLNVHYVDSHNLKRNELKKFKRSGNLLDYRNGYMLQAFKAINIIRNKFITFLNVLIEYLSSEIDLNFNALEQVFHKGKYTKTQKVSKEFQGLFKKDYNLPPTAHVASNVNNFDFDELVDINIKYVENFNFKILDVNVIGKSGNSFIDQIYKMLETIFKLVKANQEFNVIISQYVALLNIEENNQNQDIDELHYHETSIKQIVDKIYHEVYSEFNVGYTTFVRDLRGDIDLKELAHFF